MIHRSEKICPRCDAPTFKYWDDLEIEEKDMADRLGIAKLRKADIKKHRVCSRCWYSFVSAGDVA